MNAESLNRASSNRSTILTVTLTPAFKLVFVSLLALTVLGLLLACCLVGLTMNTGRSLTPQENVLFDVCTSSFKLGFGAIIGLFGGKALCRSYALGASDNGSFARHSPSAFSHRSNEAVTFPGTRFMARLTLFGSTSG